MRWRANAARAGRYLLHGLMTLGCWYAGVDARAQIEAAEEERAWRELVARLRAMPPNALTPLSGKDKFGR